MLVGKIVGQRTFRGHPAAGLITVLGAFLIQLMLGAFYTFGNVMPYFVSYMRNATGQEVGYSQFNNVNLAYSMASSTMMFFAPLILAPTIGYHGILIIATTCQVTGCLATAWMLEKNVGLVTLTYGFIQGVGGMANMACYVVPMRWFPENRGVVMGIVVAGYGISSSMWSQIQLAITNPDNVEAVYPEGETDGDKFFEDPDVLKRVPVLLYFMSLLYATMMTTGFLLMTVPKDKDEDQKEKLSNINYRKALGNFKVKILAKRQLYMLIGIRFGFTLVTNTIPGYFKAFGLALGYNDAFITNYVSTISGVSQMASRFFYGSLLDFIPFSILLGFQSSLLGIAIGLLYTVASLGSVAFVLWMHLIYFTFPGIYAILPVKCTEVFGSRYGSIVIGVVTVTDVILNLTIGLFSEAILGEAPETRDYLLYFLIISIGPCIAFLSIIFFPQTEEDKARSANMRSLLFKRGSGASAEAT